jgi:hypothetical protein
MDTLEAPTPIFIEFIFIYFCTNSILVTFLDG